MVNEIEITETINDFSSQEKKTYAELIFKLFENKYVEIYLGDSYEEVSIEQISSSYPAVFCGKVIGAFKECLIIQAIHVKKSKEVSIGNILFINERAIRSLCEVNDKCCLQDMILRSNEVSSVYKAYKNNLKVKIRK